jgi:D-alanyl-D-alanine carboxypeptidase/D-alanyl-D-alanine-endopeptidase (penicillin-binding protein 4)
MVRPLLVLGAAVLALVGLLPESATAAEAPFEPEALAVRSCRPRPDISAPGAEVPPQALLATIDEHLADDRLNGAGLGFSLWIEGYGEVEAVAADLRLKPASNQKLLTAMTAFEVLGPGHRLETQVMTTGPFGNGVLDGDVYLVGGGDATLASRGDHSLATLATAVRSAGVERITGDVLGDESRFDDLRQANGWREYNIPLSMGSLSALTVDENRYRADWPFIEEPTPHNAAAFAAALGEAGVTVEGVGVEGLAPDDAAVIVKLLSPPVGELVAEMLTESNNMIAELLTKEIGLATSGTGSTAAGVAAMRRVVSDFCLPNSTLQHDGSGLSHANARSARGWRSLLQAAQDRPWWNQFVDGLAVAAESGTLERRFVDSAAAGSLRAKTGTITGIRALSGIMTTTGGRRVFFSAIVDDDTNPRASMSAIDDLLIAVAEDES